MKPKYIRVISDLHLEQLMGQREEFLAEKFIPPDPRDAESIIVLAGDISSKPEQLIPFLGWLKDRFMKIIYIPGNHEVYGHEMMNWEANIKAAIKNNFEDGILEFPGHGVKSVELDGLRIIFGTLWGDGGQTLDDHANVARYLNDFRVVKLGDYKFKVSDMQRLHKEQKAEIKRLLEIPFDGKTVVATHHMPSYELCHPRFGTDCNGGFASHCDDLLGGEHAPAVWIHGHTHDSVDRMLHDTRIVCNPSGYRYEYGTIHNFFGPKFLTVDDLSYVDKVKPMWHATPEDVSE